jgi:hypothetical protein
VIVCLVFVSRCQVSLSTLGIGTGQGLCTLGSGAGQGGSGTRVGRDGCVICDDGSTKDCGGLSERIKDWRSEL